MVSGERLDEVVAELERLQEQLVDLAMDGLRGALGGGEHARADAVRHEKVLNRARASIDKAVRLLRSVSSEASGEADFGEADFGEAP
jgi:hypothetical protein